MNTKYILKRLTNQLPIKLVSWLITAIGLILILEVLFSHAYHLHEAAESLAPMRIVQAAPLIAGLLFVYLGTLLRRRKRSAWFVAVGLFGVYFIVGLAARSGSDVTLALLGLFGLIRYRNLYIVKSGINNPRVALRNSFYAIVLMLAFGVSGFLLLDNRAFHTEVDFRQAVLSTIDPFGIFTIQLQPHSLTGRLFLDSLYIVTIMTTAYVIFTLFGPIRQKYVDQTANRERMLALLDKYSEDSEDFFKVWPNDKHYYFYKEAALAYKVSNGVALVVGNPVGQERDFKNLVANFVSECDINDWTVAFVHINKKYVHGFEKIGFEVQKLGEEAVINTNNFIENTARNKHFRNIRNRFIKAGFKTELLEPTHNDAILSALKRVSDSWLSLPGKSERGFMLGYYDTEYISRSTVLIVRDSADQIIAFTNQVPGTKEEANIDLMRHLADAPANVNDFMFLEFFEHMQRLGYKSVNLGLCPLVGIDDSDESATAITSVLKFVYENGNRFFGFSGLARFKSKFEPEWRNRYIAYQDSIVGFTRAMNALNRAMRIKK